MMTKRVNLAALGLVVLGALGWLATRPPQEPQTAPSLEPRLEPELAARDVAVQSVEVDIGPALRELVSIPGVGDAAPPVSGAPRPSASAKPCPEPVPLPAIGGRAPDDAQSKLLRQLAHSMAFAGLDCAMPSEMSLDSWERLGLLLQPLLQERELVSNQGMKAAQEAIRLRLETGQYKVTASSIESSKTGDVYGWRRHRNAEGKEEYHVVSIPLDQVPQAAYSKSLCDSIDSKIGMISRNFFNGHEK